MTTESEQRQFAYGKDTIEDCPCPAVAAGFSPSTGRKEVTEVAGHYDHMVLDCGYNSPTSIINEKKAKNAWLKTVEWYEDLGNLKKAKIAQDIADELGWNDD